MSNQQRCFPCDSAPTPLIRPPSGVKALVLLCYSIALAGRTAQIHKKGVSISVNEKWVNPENRKKATESQKNMKFSTENHSITCFRDISLTTGGGV